MKKGRHQKKYCSQITLLYNRTTIKVSKLDLANSTESRRHSKNGHENSVQTLSTDDKHTHDKHTQKPKVQSNQKLRTRTSFMVYNEPQCQPIQIS